MSNNNNPPPPKRKRNWEKKLYITDKDVEDYYKETTGKNMFDRSDAYPAMSMAQLEGREHTDQVRKARLTQGEDTMPNSPYADDDGTWSPMRTVVPWLAEKQLNEFIAAMNLTRLQDTVLRLRLMGFQQRNIAEYIKWKTGYDMTFQSIYRVINSLRQPLLEFLTNVEYEDDREARRIYVQEVNREIAKPKSPYLQPTKCDCRTFEHLPIVTHKQEKMYVPLKETDADGKPFLHPVEFEKTSMVLECAHCRKRRTQEQYDTLMAGKEFD